jgi:hypothetical protein
MLTDALKSFGIIRTYLSREFSLSQPCLFQLVYFKKINEVKKTLGLFKGIRSEKTPEKGKGVLL